MAGIICVYGLVVAVLISGNIAPDVGYSAYDSFVHLAAGISTGFAGVAAGYAIGGFGGGRDSASSCLRMKDESKCGLSSNAMDRHCR
jgi:F0F1-type ATP synthase membrane subunit c/vacuolar-type H+-ATPase subunit K